MNLSSRLKEIVDFVPHDSKFVADIGADHGLVCLALNKRENIKIFACENKLGPYKKLNEALKNYDNILISFSDGLDDLPFEVDTLIISGMGGKTIISILERHLEHLKHLKYLVLSPHNDFFEVRKILNSFEYKIKKEKMIISQNKFYTIILYEQGKENLSFLELKYGPIILKTKDQVFKEFINKQIAKLNDIYLSYNLNLKRKKQIEDEIKELENL